VLEPRKDSALEASLGLSWARCLVSWLARGSDTESALRCRQET
jgi:hypothetical protein